MSIKEDAAIKLKEAYDAALVHQLTRSASKRDRNCQVRMMQELCAIRSLFRLRWKHWKKLWAVQISRF